MKKLLLTAFAVALFASPALADDVTIEAKPSTGSISGTTWTSNSTPAVSISLSGGALTAEGQTGFLLSTSNETRIVTLQSADPAYYVSGISMRLTGNSGDQVTFESHGVSITSGTDTIDHRFTFNESPVTYFTITPNIAQNKKAKIYDVEITLSPYTQSTRSIVADLNIGTYNNGTNWSSVWTSNSNISPSFTITASGLYMGRVNGIFDFRSGGNQSATYTIESTSPFWYVSGFSFKAKMNENLDSQRQIEIPGSEAVVLTADYQNFSATVEKGSAAIFYVKGANQAVLVSDLTVTFSPLPLSETFDAVRADEIALLTLWNPILGDELFNEKLTAINGVQADDSSTIETVDNSFKQIKADWLSEANGRLIYLKNVRRSQANGKYLTANAADLEANTKAAPIANSNWMIEIIDNVNATFKLFNPEKNKYIGKANHNTGVPLVNSADAAIFELNAVTDQGDNNGTAFHMINHNNNNYDLALNVNTSTDHLVTWNVADGGSTWTIELAGVPASQITAGKYYRIRSARALALTNKRSEGSLVGVTTNVEDGQAKGDVAVDASRFSGLGTIWRVDESDVEGKYYLRNVATDFEGQENLNHWGSGGANANVTSNPGKFQFLTKDSEWNRKHPTAVLIKTQNNEYIDVNNGGNDVAKWTKCDNNWPNNGGIYFFEEAVDYEDIKAAYIAKANETIKAKGNIQSRIDDCHAVPALWYEGDIIKVQRILDKCEDLAPSTTVASANERRTLLPPYAEAVNAIAPTIEENLYKAAENKPFIAWNIDRHGANNANYYLAFVGQCSYNDEGEKYNVVGTSLDKTSLASHWTLEYQGNGKYFIKNYFNNFYAGKNASNDHPFQTSETDGELYEVVIYTINNQKVIGFKNTDSSHPFMHQTNNGSKDYIVRWDNPESAAASGWYLAPAEADEQAVELKASSTNSRITFTIDGGTLSKHEAYGDHHAITVVKQADDAEPLSRAITEEPTSFLLGNDEHVKVYEGGFAVDYNDIDGNETLEPGTYIVTVPVAAFKTSDGKVTRTGYFTVNISENGDVNTTGIGEVSAADSKPAAEVIYDLQGRRVSKAGRGLYIINGKKTFVK